MSFDWWDYLALAEDLCSTPKDEARARSAMSRAYYACYQKAFERLPNTPAIPPGIGRHQAMWNVYKNHSNRTCRKIGIDGDRLRVARTKADYNANISNISHELTSAMINARQLKEVLSGLPTSLP